MAKEKFTVRVRSETRDALDSIASSLGRNRTYVVTEALAAFIETHQWGVDHIQQGLREADAGEFASPSEVGSTFRRLRRK